MLKEGPLLNALKATMAPKAHGSVGFSDSQPTSYMPVHVQSYDSTVCRGLGLRQEGSSLDTVWAPAPSSVIMLPQVFVASMHDASACVDRAYVMRQQEGAHHLL